ncbi:MAG: nodulation protein NfeD [Candidatus Latescibacterota bacterium]|nr:MAG: nodulation protein NfeD [Candidatus Latescibacterota bacterium]
MRTSITSSYTGPRLHGLATLLASSICRAAVCVSLLFGATAHIVTADAFPSVATQTEDAPDSASQVMIGVLQGAIGPVTKDYVHRVLEKARTEDPECVIFMMDTPGGLDASMRSIIKDIFSSPVPVVIFVYPSGGRAASAGALIGLASHVVAMAPGTNIGAAHPVPVGQGKMDEEMLEKVTNDAAAYARGIAKERGRDVEWAEKIVRESASSTAEEALELGVIDLIAGDIDELLEKLDGRTVVVDGREHTLATANAVTVEEEPSIREKFLARISDPNIAYLLMLLGIFGIFFELQNPGAIFPGVVGAIAILLAFFALQLLPVNLAGLALIVLAIIMFLLEIKIPSGGLLTIGGIVSMLIGSIMFIDSPLPFMRVSFAVIIPAVIVTALFFVFGVGMGLRAQRRKVTTGEKGIIGEIGTARTEVWESGSVFVHGEHWNAYSDEKIPAGSKIEVVAAEGMVLKVKPQGQKEVS